MPTQTPMGTQITLAIAIRPTTRTMVIALRPVAVATSDIDRPSKTNCQTFQSEKPDSIRTIASQRPSVPRAETVLGVPRFAVINRGCRR
jgi:hypothetical protein